MLLAEPIAWALTVLAEDTTTSLVVLHDSLAGAVALLEPNNAFCNAELVDDFLIEHLDTYLPVGGKMIQHHGPCVSPRSRGPAWLCLFVWNFCKYVGCLIGFFKLD